MARFICTDCGLEVDTDSTSLKEWDRIAEMKKMHIWIRIRKGE